MDRLFRYSAFDLNKDGKIDGAEWVFIIDTLFNDEDTSSEYDDDVVDELDLAGINRDKLEFMDEDERRETLEDAGLDPDDFDDFDF